MDEASGQPMLGAAIAGIGHEPTRGIAVVAERLSQGRVGAVQGRGPVG
jgi:hypothetical protein